MGSQSERSCLYSLSVLLLIANARCRISPARRAVAFKGVGELGGRIGGAWGKGGGEGGPFVRVVLATRPSPPYPRRQRSRRPRRQRRPRRPQRHRPHRHGARLYQQWSSPPRREMLR